MTEDVYSLAVIQPAPTGSGSQVSYIPKQDVEGFTFGIADALMDGRFDMPEFDYALGVMAAVDAISRNALGWDDPVGTVRTLMGDVADVTDARRKMTDALGAYCRKLGAGA